MPTAPRPETLPPPTDPRRHPPPAPFMRPPMLLSLLPLLQATGPIVPAASTSRLDDTAFAFLLFGGTLFWSIAFLFVVVLSVQVAREASVAAFLTLVIGGVVLSWISHFPVRSWVLDHPGDVLRWVVVYYAGGIAWASWKFVRYHRRRVRPYRAWREQQLAKYGVATAEELSDEQAFQYQEAAAKAGFPLRTMGQITNLKTYSRDFVFWASYWPFSLLGTLLRFVLRDAFTAIFRGVFAALGGTIRTWLSALYRDVHADRDAVLAKADAFRVRRDAEAARAGGTPGAGPGSGPEGDAGGGPRRGAVRVKL